MGGGRGEGAAVLLKGVSCEIIEMEKGLCACATNVYKFN